jgi:hypothetical protein
MVVIPIAPEASLPAKRSVGRIHPLEGRPLSPERQDLTTDTLDFSPGNAGSGLAARRFVREEEQKKGCLSFSSEAAFFFTQATCCPCGTQGGVSLLIRGRFHILPHFLNYA